MLPPAAEMTEDIATLMRDALGADGASVQDAVAQCRRQLPRKLRREADFLAEIEPLAGHPKLARQIDRDRLMRAHGALRAHLKGLQKQRRRGEVALAILGSLAVSLLGVTGLVLALLYWRGFF